MLALSILDRLTQVATKLLAQGFPSGRFELRILHSHRLIALWMIIWEQEVILHYVDFLKLRCMKNCCLPLGIPDFYQFQEIQ